MGEALKRKNSEKASSDDFEKKYDKLFDQVFSQEKLKQEKLELKEKKRSE
jgi:hypothetical protein